MSKSSLVFTSNAGARLRGSLRVPGDKSISHRSIMLGSLAEGITEIDGFLQGEDSLATLRAFKAMGVAINGPDEGRVVIEGVGLRGLSAPAEPLDVGNSGTSMRLLTGLLAGQSFNSILTGDHSLSSRPMRRVLTPLVAMGAGLVATDAGTAPINITGGAALTALDYVLPVASAQVKSAILLAGLYAQGETRVTEPAPTRDHTERMLRGFGYAVTTHGRRASVRGGGTLTGIKLDVPADISSAAFFMVAASILPGSELTLQKVGVNPTRTGIIDILRQMGASIEMKNETVMGGEPVADITVRSRELHGIRIPAAQVPLAIDEFPVIFIAAACAKGETILTGAHELRVKESDRIQAMADGLQCLGVRAEPTEDGIVIQGSEMTAGTVDSLGDHRIAMAFSVAGLVAAGPVQITDCANVNTSFPGFVERANGVGFVLSAANQP